MASFRVEIKQFLWNRILVKKGSAYEFSCPERQGCLQNTAVSLCMSKLIKLSKIGGPTDASCSVFSA